MNNEELEIDFLINQLHRIRVNLKKAPFRQYLRSTLQKKIEFVKKNYIMILLQN